MTVVTPTRTCHDNDDILVGHVTRVVTHLRHVMTMVKHVTMVVTHLRHITTMVTETTGTCMNDDTIGTYHMTQSQ